MVVAVFFTVCAVLSVILLKMVRLVFFLFVCFYFLNIAWFILVSLLSRRRNCFQVHSHYRHTGASFQKAQQEFSQGVLTNRTFQTAAASAATSAAQSSLQRNWNSAENSPNPLRATAPKRTPVQAVPLPRNALAFRLQSTLWEFTYRVCEAEGVELQHSVTCLYVCMYASSLNGYCDR